MSPYEIEILLHIYCSPAELPQAKTPLLERTLKDFENEGLIIPSFHRDSGWSTLPKGDAFVELLCNTPIPKGGWFDPRNGEIIEGKT